MQITKADGTQEVFRPQKLKSSLQKAGATKTEISSIVSEIEHMLYPGMKTQEIYKKAFKLLRESTQPIAAKYSLRRALFNLGPTGFPFEDFLSKLFQKDGYEITLRTEIKGRCALHEVDLAGYKDDRSFVAEAKFHSRPGIKSDLQVALYSYARFLDIQAYPVCKEDKCGITDLFAITNTKFTTAAHRYARCVGLTLIDWDYPKKGNLQDKIEEYSLYPVTVLSTLSNAQKQMLLEQNILLCSDIIAKEHRLSKMGLNKAKVQAVISEARQLCT